jgi:radical SAM superfamily enzyme YgiQ (UPF0313 family)
MNKGKVLFIISDLYQEDVFFPLSIGYLISSLHNTFPNVESEVYDMALTHATNEELADYLQDNKFTMICLGFLSARFKETIEPLCKVINQHKKDSVLILGGHGASGLPEWILQKTQADIVCLGEGEEVIPEIYDTCVNGKSLLNIDGIAFRNGNKITINPKRKPIKNLDSLPYPYWEKFDMSRYTTNIKLALMEDNDKCFPMISTRGCSNACTFCYRMHRGIAVRSIPNIIEEIKILNQIYGVSYVFFFDEMWILTKKRVYEFAKALKDNNLNIKFNINARVEIIDENIIKCLKDSGCVFINYGFEGNQQNILDTMKKNATVEQNYHAAEITYKYDLGMGINVLWGFKGDNEETLRKNVDFVKQFSKFDQIRTVRFPTPYPICELYNQAIADGKLKDADDFFNKFKNSDLMTVNFTDLPLEECYRLMFEANKELITFHYENTNNDMVAANKLIQDFKDLYDGKDIKFRGARSDATNEDKRKIIR